MNAFALKTIRLAGIRTSNASVLKPAVLLFNRKEPLRFTISDAMAQRGAMRYREALGPRSVVLVWCSLALLMLEMSAVGQVQPPVVSTITSQSVVAGGSLGITFSTWDPQNSAVSVTASSSDLSLVHNSDILVNLVSVDSAGTNTWNLTLKTQSNTSGGTCTITISVTDGLGLTTTVSFNLLMREGPRPYMNTTPIMILDNSVAEPSPSIISVSGYVGAISKVTVTLRNFSHTFPSDVGMLLVGPAGQKVVLMNRVGDGHPGVTGLNLAFDQSIGNASVPTNSAPSTGSYLPTDNSGGVRTFASPAPRAPYTNTLDAFNGTSPNGIWSLYVQDFEPADSGTISNGWSIGITTWPLVLGLNDVTVPENAPARADFTIADDTLSASVYTFSATSDTPSVVTNGGITFSGSGTNWTVTVNPVANALGTATITMTMVNGDGQTVTSSFKATFTATFLPPTIATVPEQSMPAGSYISIPLVYSSVSFPPNQLALTFSSSDTNLVPFNNMKLIGTNLFLAPAGVLTGSSTIGVTVTDPGHLATNINFKLNVLPAPETFANTSPITINDNRAAAPYPSTINVSGLAGNISAVTATVAGLGHAFPQDISILLAGPQGQKVVLMSRAGGSAAMTNTWVTFYDDASASVSQFTLIADGSYKPTDYKASDTFFSPAPPAPYAHALSAFTGTNPNGTWSLYVQDDQPPDSGLITGGWVLTVVTTPTGPPSIGAQTTPENVPITVPFSVSSATTSASNLIVTATHTGDNPAGLISSLKLSGSGGARTLLITPAANLPSLVTNVDGTSTITVSVTDGTLTNSETFPLTVTYVDQAPVVTGLSDQTTAANVPLTVNFSVNDIDSPSNTVAATGSVPALGTIAVSGSGTARTLTFTPARITGVDLVTVTTSDSHNTVTNTFSITVTNSTLPIVSHINDVTIPKANTVTAVPVNFTVDTGPIAATNVDVVASADNTNLVTSVIISSNNDSSYTLTATIAPNTSGNCTITIFAHSEYGTGTTSFSLTVLGPSQPPLLSISRAGDLLKIRFVGARSNALCILQKTDDFNAWANAATATADTSGAVEFDINPAPASSSQFYRVLAE